MSAGDEPARVLLAAAPARLEVLRPLFVSAVLRGWEPVEADTVQRAHFIGQLYPCEAVVVDADLIHEGGWPWLQAQHMPLLLLGDSWPPALPQPRTSVWSRLPRDVVAGSPSLLAETLEHLRQVADVRTGQALTEAALRESRRQIDRLIDLLWQVVPGELPGQWLSQRHMLERCDEEIARSQRHGAPLSVVLGEVSSAKADVEGLSTRWMAERICCTKRRSDVAGQYGLRGFMLLLPSTAATGAAACCRRLHQVLLAAPPVSEAPTLAIQPSFGIAECTKEARTVQSVLRVAEEGLEQARREGAPAVP
jgi:diguanylate cyclase (GGDEF)-like protein